MAPRPLPRLRRICLALPEVVEVEAWGAPTFRCGRIFAMYAHPGDHHGGGRHGVWLKAAPGNQALMVADRPNRFFVPPYVGPGGWIGVWLDRNPPWKEIAVLVEDSWRLIAPKRIVAARGKTDGRGGRKKKAAGSQKKKAVGSRRKKTN